MPQTVEKPMDVMDPANQSSDMPPQTKEEMDEAMRVQRLFRAAYTAKYALNLPEKWRTFDDYKHARFGMPENAEDPNSSTPVIHPIIESQIADLIDRNYAVQAKGVEISDDLYATQVQHLLEFVLSKNQFKRKLELAEHDRLELGTAIYKVYFDPDDLDGRGLPKFEVVNPANFFPDPKVQAPYLIQDAEFIIHAVPRPLSWFRKQFPKMGKYVKRQVAVPYDPLIYDGQHSDESDYLSSMRALCIECYERDEDGNLFRLTVANNILLEDTRKTMKGKKIQREDKYPFVAIPCYLQRGMIWGQGDVELLMPIQDLINELDDQIRINTRLMGNPQIAYGINVGKGFDVRKWTTKPGLRIPMMDVNAFRVVEAQQVSPDVVVRREKAFQEADLVSGRPDVTRGERPNQVTAYRAIAALQQAGQRGVIHKTEMLKNGLSEVLELLYDEIILNWDERMWIRIEGEKPDYEFVDPNELKQVKRMIPNLAAGPNDDTLVPLTDENGNPMTRDAQFDFSISIGDGLPTDKAFIYETLLDLSKLIVEGKPIIFWKELRDYLREEIGLPLKPDDTIDQAEMMQQPINPAQPINPMIPANTPQPQPLNQGMMPPMLQGGDLLANPG